MKMIIRVSEISKVKHYTKGFTDYLQVHYTDNTYSSWSVNHYEESMTQREKCKQLEDVYKRISNACICGVEFVEFNID